MYPLLFEIGPLTIYSLGVFWALGALAAVWILRLYLVLAGVMRFLVEFWRANPVVGWE
jgi:prolipoprotein diacylglyceryltransferase